MKHQRTLSICSLCVSIFILVVSSINFCVIFQSYRNLRDQRQNLQKHQFELEYMKAELKEMEQYYSNPYGKPR